MLTLKDLIQLAEPHQETLEATVREFTIGSRHFAFNQSQAIMGVINLSPDSWYRESVCLNTDQAIERAATLQAQGADLIDLGAESTLDQADRVNGEKQLAQLLPILKAYKDSNLLFSVETYEPAVAEACLRAGAKVLNITGLAHAEKLFTMAAAHEAAVILCHVEGPNPREVTDLTVAREQDPIGPLSDYFARHIDLAEACGLQKIIIDPGLGFYYRNLQDSAERIRYQMRMFLHSFRLRKLGVPVCHALPHAFECFGEEVRSAEPFFSVLAALGKTDLFRTHEVARVRAVLKTLAVY